LIFIEPPVGHALFVIYEYFQIYDIESIPITCFSIISFALPFGVRVNICFAIAAY